MRSDFSLKTYVHAIPSASADVSRIGLTAVLTEIGFDPERISNHCRGVTKRGR